MTESYNNDALVNNSIFILYVSFINASEDKYSLEFSFLFAFVATIQASFIISSSPEYIWNIDTVTSSEYDF